MEVNSALMVQDLKDVETNLVVVDLFKDSVESIFFHIRWRTNLNHIVSPTKKKALFQHVDAEKHFKSGLLEVVNALWIGQKYNWKYHG